MAYSSIEDKYLSALTAAQFPDMPVEPAMPEQSMPGRQEGDIMLAEAGAGRGSYEGFSPRQAYTNAGPKDEMKAFDPTIKQRLADFLQSKFVDLGMDQYKARKNAQTLIGGASSNLPLDVGLADFLPFLGTTMQMEESGIMAGEAYESVKRGDYGTAAMQAGGAALGLVPGAASTIKATKTMANKVMSKTQTPSTITSSGVSYETVQDGPFFRVSKAGNSASTAAAGEGRIYEGTAIENRAGSGRPTVYGDKAGQAEQEVQLRLNSKNNQALKIAEQYTQQNTGKPYDYGLTIEPSSLSKQSPVGVAYDLAAKRALGYDVAVFDAYKADPEYGKLIDQLGIKTYDELVQQAYKQLEKETIDQFNALPVKFSYHKSGEGNYLDSKEMLRDVHLHNHMYVYQGGDQHEFLNKVDPSTGLNSNEMFRAVHDYFGHAIKGNTFGPIGEEVAWASHAQMYSPLARIAMTAETRGQNSFVNYTPINADLIAQMEDVRRAMIDAQRAGKNDKVEQYKEALRNLGGQWQYAPQASVALPPEMTRLDYKGGMPNYLRTLQTPEGQTFPVEHYSKSAEMQTTDPTKYGTGAKGFERERLDSPNAIRDRTFFYESGGKPEEVVVTQAPYKYKGIAKDLYDFDKDPLNLRKLSRVKNTNPADAKYNANVLDEQSMINDVERMIYERGFKGYVTGKQGNRAIVSFEPVAVERTQ